MTWEISPAMYSKHSRRPFALTPTPSPFAPRRTAIAALNQTLVDLLDGRSQVLLNLHIYQVAQMRMTNLGAQLPLSTTIFNVPTQVNQIFRQTRAPRSRLSRRAWRPAGDDIAIVAVLIATGVVTGTVFQSAVRSLWRRYHSKRPLAGPGRYAKHRPQLIRHAHSSIRSSCAFRIRKTPRFAAACAIPSSRPPTPD